MGLSPSESVERYAPWVGSPEDWREQELKEKRWALRFAAPLKALAVAIAAGMIAAAVLVDSYVARTMIWQLLVAEVCLASALVLWLMQQAQIYESLSKLDRKPDSGALEWQVKMDIVQDDLVTGSDMGMLWDTADRLYFVGERTSFALGRSDLRSGVTVLRSPKYGLERTLTVPLRPPPGQCREMSVRFDLIHDAFDSAKAQLCIVHLQNFFASPFRERGQLPPITLGPGSDQPRFLVARATWMVCLVVAAGGTCGFVACLVAYVILEEGIVNRHFHFATCLFFGVVVGFIAMRSMSYGLKKSLRAIRTYRRLSIPRFGARVAYLTAPDE